jgi:hypothetical protein
VAHGAEADVVRHVVGEHEVGDHASRPFPEIGPIHPAERSSRVRSQVGFKQGTRGGGEEKRWKTELDSPGEEVVRRRGRSPDLWLLCIHQRGFKIAGGGRSEAGAPMYEH